MKTFDARYFIVPITNANPTVFPTLGALRFQTLATPDLPPFSVDLKRFLERPSYQDRRSVVVLMLDDDSGIHTNRITRHSKPRD